jgi:5'(3')-deoxyribonucleotidase
MAGEKKFPGYTVCIDFDGTLFDFPEERDFFHVGKIIPGAKEAVLKFLEEGYEVVIHTARPNTEEIHRVIHEALRSEGLPELPINKAQLCVGPNSKPIAILYIDDRALRFDGDWKKTMHEAASILGFSD